ncbi:hypothetical protein KP509_14G043300 [Ceratopteris richardii]|uniref:Uncharacterized protein n=1 Tax=Ceratopteris richardii TaxID=49495 RepID=A0A8T2TCI7_CERRI|nr:hypothetical protein KP509_14G043300 [Ceratopteris richardii]KAH7415433.1 hypothetical protein KP509_14G043300 [Ceratopteris richardii]
MNRDVGRGTGALQQEPSSSYLLLLFISSAIFFIALPYLLPFGGSLLWWRRKGTAEEPKLKFSEKTDPDYKYAYLSTNVLTSRQYSHDSKHEEVHSSIVNLQKTLQIERERIAQLESEIYILQLSERYLKERVQKLEAGQFGYSRSVSSPSVPIEHLMERTVNVQKKLESMDDLVEELLRMLQTEREKVSSLALEVRTLRVSESTLTDKIKNLEEKFNEFLSKNEQNEDSSYKYVQKIVREF